MNRTVTCTRSAHDVRLRRFIRALYRFLPLLASVLMCDALYAQTPNPSIWMIAYGNNQYAFASQSTDANGNYVLQFNASDNSTAKLTWNATTSAITQLVFTQSDATVVTYTNNGSGVFNRTGGGSNLLQQIASMTYGGNLTSAVPSGDYSTFGISSFVYNTETFSEVFALYDSQGIHQRYYVGTNGGTAQEQDQNSSTLFVGMQIKTGTGLIANYTSGANFTYVLSPTSTGTNALSSMNGMTLAGDTLSKQTPAPFHTIQFGNDLLTLTYNFFDKNGNQSVTRCNYSSTNGMFWIVLWDGTEFTMYYAGSEGDYQDGILYQRPKTFHHSGAMPSVDHILDAVDGKQYVADGQFIIPAPTQVPAAPVRNFQYNGERYSLVGYGIWSGGDAVYQLQGANSGTATVKWNPTTQSVDSWTIHPTGGGTDTYVGGVAPGSYVLQSGSPQGNVLSLVNNMTYTISGNNATPPSTTSNNGDIAIQGNQLNLGLWLDDPTKTGMWLNYYDGGTTYETDIVMTSSRPSTVWSWENPTNDGLSTVPAMLVSAVHALQLYPTDPAVTATGPMPTIVLDPNPSGISRFEGGTRFDGPVRVAPQGDLSMGGFTAEPTLTPAP